MACRPPCRACDPAPLPDPTVPALLRHPLIIALGCVTLALVVFAPRLWLLRQPVPGSFQWDRAVTFLQQVESPFRRDIEPAMLWRQLPAVVCHYAGLRGQAAFAFPWLGALAAVAYVATVASRHNPDLRFVGGCTLLYTSSSALLVPLHWWGINDGWIWLGLLAVAFARSRVAMIAALLLCPWVDERFLIALPLTLLVRGHMGGHGFSWRQFLPLAWVLPYLVARAVLSGPGSEGVQNGYLAERAQMLAGLAPFAPLGWWMALRGGWVAVGYAVTLGGCRIAAATALTLLICFALASDISRSAAVLTPLLLAGCIEWNRRHPADSATHVWRLAWLNLLLPAAHVVHDKIDLISPLPVELLRLWRIAG